MKRALPALALLAATAIAVRPAAAQSGYGYGYRPAPDYDEDGGTIRRPRQGYDEDRGYIRRPRPDYDEDQGTIRRPRRGYEDEERGPVYRESPRYQSPGSGRSQIGRICVTARGNCPANPAPVGSSCGCEIPGFGFKRGAIGG